MTAGLSGTWRIRRKGVVDVDVDVDVRSHYLVCRADPTPWAGPARKHRAGCQSGLG